MVIIAPFFGLFNILLINIFVIIIVLKAFVFNISITNYNWVLSFILFKYSSILPAVATPTLFTKIETSKFSNSFYISKYLATSAFEKSTIIYLVSTNNWEQTFYIFSSFLAIIQILNPKPANYLQNSSPIPSLPPVMTAQLPSPYLLVRSLFVNTSYFIVDSIDEVYLIA